MKPFPLLHQEAKKPDSRELALLRAAFLKPLILYARRGYKIKDF